MTLGLLFQPVDPFPDPVHAGQEIEFIGVLASSILILVFLICLMLLCYFKFRKVLPAITILGFSFIIAIEFLINGYIPSSIYFSIFFIVFQTVMFIMLMLHLEEEI